MTCVLSHERIVPSRENAARTAAPASPTGEAAGRPLPRWIVFLHGFFGAGRNWRSVARRLSEARPGWNGLLADLRLHGGSRGMGPPHTLDACVEDVQTLVGELAPQRTVVLGHSFGGKVALLYGEVARPSPEQLWIIDSTPSARGSGGDAHRMLGALRERPGPFAEREDAVSALREEGFDEEVARWMTVNLEEGEGGLTWDFDLEALSGLLEDFFRVDAWGAVQRRGGPEVHFVKGTDSSLLSDRECGRIETAGADNGRVFLHRIRGGHWLNADNPAGILRLMEERLPDDSMD